MRGGSRMDYNRKLHYPRLTLQLFFVMPFLIGIPILPAWLKRWRDGSGKPVNKLG